MLSTQEVAKLLGVSQRRVVALIRSGDLLATKVGRTWVIDEISVEQRASSPRLKGRPRGGQKNNMHQRRLTLMNRDHAVLDFTYDVQRKSAVIDAVHEDAAFMPPGAGRRDKGPNQYDLSAWINHRYMPGLRPEAMQLMRQAGVDSTDDLMFSSLGLNLSDQYWFRPADFPLTWGDINFFQNGYTAFAKTPDRSPDSSTPGALRKHWQRVGKRDLLFKGASTLENREPFNELLATRLMERLLQPKEFVPYTLEEADGMLFSVCPTFITPQTEFVTADAFAVYAGIRSGDDFYRAYAAACEEFGIEDARTSLAKMIVADYLMANFDRHRGNFGLVRNAETLDGWRIAPLFDNGAGFFSRASMADMRSEYFSYTAAPFLEYPSQQLALVQDMSWYDPSQLADFPDVVGQVLSGNSALPEEFVHHAMRHVQRSIDTVNALAHERQR